MKNFTRDNLSFSLCGLNCRLCPMQIGRYCPGCGGGAGNQACAIARCSLQHDNVEYCFLCPEFPCDQYAGVENYDSFITHQRQLSHIQRASDIGIEAYNQEQIRKFDILRTLLSNYDDGRRKTIYCVAVNLLPLKQVESVMEQVANDETLLALTLKEKATIIVSLLQDRAAKEGLVLKLRKKPEL